MPPLTRRARDPAQRWLPEGECTAACSGHATAHCRLRACRASERGSGAKTRQIIDGYFTGRAADGAEAASHGKSHQLPPPPCVCPRMCSSRGRDMTVRCRRRRRRRVECLTGFLWQALASRAASCRLCSASSGSASPLRTWRSSSTTSRRCVQPGRPSTSGPPSLACPALSVWGGGAGSARTPARGGAHDMHHPDGGGAEIRAPAVLILICAQGGATLPRAAFDEIFPLPPQVCTANAPRMTLMMRRARHLKATTPQ
jgi:hypothetical protein